MKDNRLSFLWSPVFKVNVDAVLGGDKCHITDSSFRITSLQAVLGLNADGGRQECRPHRNVMPVTV